MEHRRIVPGRELRNSAAYLLAGALLVSLVLCQPGCTSTKSPQSSKSQTITTVRTGPRDRTARPVPDPGSGTAVAPITNNDPCAGRLHQICGALLMYYAINHRLPDNLDELRQVPGFELSDNQFFCPVSRLPYIYDRIGVPAPAAAGGQIILADAAPSHSHMRWAVSIVEPQDPAQALVTKVIAVPESYFNVRRVPMSSTGP